MDKEESFIGTRKAAQLSGLSIRTIQTLIKKGKLSATGGDAGNYLIDKAEFYRVFPDAHVRTDAQNNDDDTRKALDVEIQYLKEMNKLLRDQLDRSVEEKTVILEALNNTQKLLEHDGKKKKRWFGLK